MDFKYIVKYEDERLEFVKDLKELSEKLYYEESYLKSRIGKTSSFKTQQGITVYKADCLLRNYGFLRRTDFEKVIELILNLAEKELKPETFKLIKKSLSC